METTSSTFNNNKLNKESLYKEEEQNDDDNELFYIQHPFKKSIKVLIKKLYFKNSSINIKISDNTDLIPGKYEGGVKLWECAIDLLEYLPIFFQSNENKNLLEKIISNKGNCLELGCGHGLPGLYCLSIGMKVAFQDFNIEVLNTITNKYISNLITHNEDLKLELTKNTNYFFIDGDWAGIQQRVTDSNENNCVKLFENKFDFILSSDTIYNTDNYESFHKTLESYLAKDGKCLISSKYFYFGVGGGVNQFCDFLEEKKVFSYRNISEIRNGFSNIRIIIELTFK
jgi:hypothetical protein